MYMHYDFYFSAYICERHFEDDMIIRKGSRVKLVLGAIPTKFLPDECKPPKVMQYTMLLFNIGKALMLTHILYR